MKKKLIIFSLILSALTTIACRTTSEIKITLPPEPERKNIPIPASPKEYAEVIAYYDELVSEWELWAETTQKIISRRNLLSERSE